MKPLAVLALLIASACTQPIAPVDIPPTDHGVTHGTPVYGPRETPKQ